MVFWAALLVLIACVWASRHLTISRARRDFPPLTESYPGGNAELPFLSVLIAAKDEEANIETAVRTMLDQDYPRFELIVINDRSSDRTAEILESIKAERTDGRLKVIHIKELREGWFGKNNAMQTGMQEAKGQWLCFGDADCRQTSFKTLSAAVRFAMANKVDLLSVLPELETHSIWERIIQPVCGAVMVFWFQPSRVNDPKRPEAYANGAFMLMTRACYDAIGGHEAGPHREVNEGHAHGPLDQGNTGNGCTLFRGTACTRCGCTPACSRSGAAGAGSSTAASARSASCSSPCVCSPL